MAKSGLGCEPAVGSLTASRKREYKVSNRVHEGKRPLYAMAFNFIDARYYDVFATVGGNRVSSCPTVTVYRCLEGGLVAVLQAYVDEDKDESFYTLSWACDTDGTPLLVAGGSNGIIRVINAGTEKIHKDFHPSDIYRIASCGMDNTVKIWSMKGAEVTMVELSLTDTTRYLSVPYVGMLGTTWYVSYRQLIDTLSVDNEIVLWEPKTKEQNPGDLRPLEFWKAPYLAVVRMARYGAGTQSHEDTKCLRLLNSNL
ncbi:hypothetical protein BHM03_00053782, partial [Ensete ventricosum]